MHSEVKISALLTETKPAPFLIVLSLVLSIFARSTLSASGGGSQPAGSSVQAKFSADDFDWRAMIPYLSAAAALPPEQGIETMLQNSRVLRAYVAQQIRTECTLDKRLCVAGDVLTLQEEVSKRIDGTIQKGMVHEHKSAVVDCPLTQPFPFSEISVLRSEKQQDAYLVLELADRSYTAAQVQAKYGSPYDTDIFQQYSVFKYRLDSPQYRSKAVFEIDPLDGAVMKIAISLKARNHH
ncbi:MAG: hypothetical protein WAK89_10260 [Candidatus Sulfotelmatobacter sp.]